MKVLATLKNVDSTSCKRVIIRNLSRILDIKIIDIDVEQGVISFMYSAQDSFNQVKRELLRLGFPMQNYTSIFNSEQEFTKSGLSNPSDYSYRARTLHKN
jgi:hypothetical protein